MSAPATGTRVAFIHAALGRLEGEVVKHFKNGKLQVSCAVRFSRADNRGGIRKTMYNVEADELEGSEAYARDLAAYEARGTGR
jgi:hypothetical protein